MNGHTEQGLNEFFFQFLQRLFIRLRWFHENAGGTEPNV